jgi:hypothetical protein
VITESERQSIADGEHLKLLSIGYWVWGGIMGAYSVGIGLYFAFIGTVFLSIPDGADAPPDVFRWFFPVMGIAMFLAFGTLAALQIANGFWIRKRVRRVLSMVIAGFTCASVPVGTMLGVFSFVVLARPTVRALYGLPPASAEAAVPAPLSEGSESPPASDELT